MTRTFAALLVLTAAGVAAVPPPREPAWPTFGGTPARNMVAPHAGRLPDTFDPATGANVLWKADLGTRSYSQPVVAGGRVFVGTNNERPRNRRDARRNADGEVEPFDRGVLMCFDADSGRFLWQAVHDVPPAWARGNGAWWPKEGIVSTPAVEGGRVYYLSGGGEVVCADAAGLADGNQGFRGEKYTDPTDADLLWVVDLAKDYGVFPHNTTSCSPLLVGDALFVVTGNGVDAGHIDIPAPDAPSFLALDRHTGRLLWKDNSPGKGVMHGQWSSPAYADAPVPQVIFPGGDGWLRGFDPKTGTLLWKFDANPSGAKYELGGAGRRNDFIATPVVANGRLFIGTGQDPEHTTGQADLWCVDLAKAVANGAKTAVRDVSSAGPHSAAVWHYGGDDRRPFAPREFTFGRTMSNALVVGDVLYVGELQGHLHCLDARTGKPYWVYDTKGSVWGSPFFVDGRVYLPTDSGDLFVFRHDPAPAAFDGYDFTAVDRLDARRKLADRRRELEAKVLVRKVEFDASLRATPSAAGGVLYATTEKTLYAIGRK